MKLGIVLPEGQLQQEMSLIKQKFPDIVIEIFLYSSVFHLPELLRGKQKYLDALLFFGQTTLEYTASKITPTIPWEVVPRTSTTLLMVLLKALLRGDNIYNLITDIHPEERKLLRSAYKEAGIDLSKVSVTYAPPYPFDELFVGKLIDFYDTCQRSKKDSTCFTIYSDVYRRLKEHSFPILYHFPSLPDIYCAIEKIHAKFLLQISRESQLIIINIVINDASEYSPLLSDEYQQTLERLNVAKYIHLFAKKVQGAVLSTTERDFLIFSTRTIVENQTDKFQHFSLLDDICTHTASTLSIGLGFGRTAMEAKKHARIGVKKAQNLEGNQIFLVYDKDTIRHATGSAPKQDINISDRFLSISAKTGVSAFTLGNIHKLINEHGKSEFTSVELSELMNISMRSVNRMIVKLMDAGYCFEVGQKFQHKGGRPSRILRFTI